ncbi:MAG: SDR family NAD(P)-dependent oxidoreductase [Gordonia sp. (in: high G+C Gram-positive bacteria)]|uniref:SDR family NAD(P)-dependent oxidoreductase n=1 Tax=Gordonia sp. (in: high G+C Gram-positive bacteria) TaxID=84139 RepID=UPI0039E56DC6
MDLTGRRALITGASSGIGREIALQLAARNVRLVVAARGREALDEVAALTGAEVHTVDLSVRGAAATLAAAVGPVDILVNNAGAGVAAPVAALEHDRIDVVYPRIYRPALAFPTLGRRMLRRLARNVRVDDDIRVQTGSTGDPAARDARAAWRPRRS